MFVFLQMFIKSTSLIPQDRASVSDVETKSALTLNNVAEHVMNSEILPSQMGARPDVLKFFASLFNPQQNVLTLEEG